MKPVVEHDVIVIGAGPGGSSTAIQLAAIGLDVAVIERRLFPRPQVGICISDQTLALLNYLDLDDEFRSAGFWRRYLTSVKWGNAGTSVIPQKGFHLDRAVFDRLSLGRACTAGVTVYQPARVLELRRLKDSRWRMTIADEDGRQVLDGRFIVDAAGRRSALRGPRIKDSPPLVAFHANWLVRDPPDFDGLIESGEDAWLWYARTAHDRAVISVFCDPRHLGSKKKRGELQATYVRLLEQFHELRPNRLGQQCSGPQACDASSSHSGDVVSNRHIRVGDACLSVDPLSSQGVHLALQSGIQAAVIINTILKKPMNSELAKRFFRHRVAERVGRYNDKTRSEYSRVSAGRPELFWHERASDVATRNPRAESSPIDPLTQPGPQQVAVSPEAKIARAPVIDGMYVEEHEVLRHPNIEGAIAYVDGINVVALLAALPDQLSFRNIPAFWRDQVPTQTAGRIASWLWSKGILVQAT